MSSITRDDIIQFPPIQLAQGKAPSTGDRYGAIMSRMFIDTGVANPVKAIARPCVRNARPRFLSGDEDSRLLQACGARGLQNGVLAALQTGCRLSELTSPTWAESTPTWSRGGAGRWRQERGDA